MVWQSCVVEPFSGIVMLLLFVALGVWYLVLLVFFLFQVSVSVVSSILSSIGGRIPIYCHDRE